VKKFFTLFPSILFTLCIVAQSQSPYIEWQKSLGGTNGDVARSIEQTNDGGYIVAGYSYSYDGDASGLHSGFFWDYWVIKLNSLGAIQWQKMLGGTNTDFAYSIHQTQDSGYIVAGYAD
jgi:hypothetical protein